MTKIGPKKSKFWKKKQNKNHNSSKLRQRPTKHTNKYQHLSFKNGLKIEDIHPGNMLLAMRCVMILPMEPNMA